MNGRDLTFSNISYTTHNFIRNGIREPLLKATMQVSIVSTTNWDYPILAHTQRVWVPGYFDGNWYQGVLKGMGTRVFSRVWVPGYFEGYGY